MKTTSSKGWTVPEQRPSDGPKPSLEPKAVRRWLTMLPMADTAATARALTAAISETNALQLSPARRLRFLEQTADVIHYVVESQRKQYAAQQFPLSERKQRALELSVALLEATCLGYLAIASPVFAKRDKLRKAKLSRAVYQGLRFGGQLLLEHYVVYQPAPPGLWRYLHRLYRHAEQHEIHTLPLNDAGPEPARRTNIAEVYRQILLIALIGPYRMRPFEAVDKYRQLRRWAGYVALEDVAAHADALFRVNLDSDAPPAPAQQLRRSAFSRAVLIDAVIQRLEETARGRRPRWQPWRKPRPPADAAELSKLKQLLAHSLPRRFPRRPQNGHVEVVIGLSTVSGYLAEEQNQSYQTAVTNSQYEVRELTATEDTSSDVWAMIYPSELLQRLKVEEEPAADQPCSAHTETQWNVLNASAGGYCILARPEQAAKAQVGDIIALRAPAGARQRHWQAGVIRWLKYVHDEGLQLGIEVLASNPIPVIAQPRLEAGYGTPSRALLLPEVLATETTVSVITPSLNYAEGCKVLLESGGDRSEIVLGRTLESTGLFSRFEFHASGSDQRDQSFAAALEAL